MKLSFVSKSPLQTELFGKYLASTFKGGEVIALDGDLGAGKTCLTRGLAKGLRITTPVLSPTFTIVNEYEGYGPKMYHFDTYRLSGEEDFLMSGFDEYFDYGGVCVIEWAEQIDGCLPENALKIKISGNGDERLFEIEGDIATVSGCEIAAKSAGCEVL